MSQFTNRHYLIIGAGKQGLALADYVVKHGGKVTITDLRSVDELSKTIKERKNPNIKWHLGSHPTELLNDVDFVCPSGGVPLSIPLLVEAKNQNIAFTNDSQIFTELSSGVQVGITGTAGKTTTSLLMGRIGELAVQEETFTASYTGGNIGNPLILELDKIIKTDISITEYSSFQLDIMENSPNIAAILNISPNHLDRHGSMKNYIQAKTNITAHQNQNDLFIFGRDDEEATAVSKISQAHLYSFGFSNLPDDSLGTYIKNDEIWMKSSYANEAVFSISDIELMGHHNILNVMAAITIASVANISISAIQKGIQGFRGLPHRLEYVRTWNGAKWYNDSKATGPQMVLQAINSFDSPTILLAGGRDKDLPWENFARKTANSGHRFVLFGDSAPLINQALVTENKNVIPDKFSTLAEAITFTKTIASQNDIVLLSPGGTSFDEFSNYEERGNFFKSIVLGFEE